MPELKVYLKLLDGWLAASAVNAIKSTSSFACLNFPKRISVN
jgi:hypothetical protein